MEIDPTRMCELLVGLPSVNVLGIEDEPGGRLIVHIECRGSRPFCITCNSIVVIKERPVVDLVDLPAFGRPAHLLWHKHRFRCQDPMCPAGSWTEENRLIAAPRLAMTDRAGRWVTEQVGRHARSVNEIARELGCDWHTVNDTVIAYGEALVDNPDRYGPPEALGLDEVLFVKTGEFHKQHYSTQIVDVKAGQLLDVVKGRGGKEPTQWLEKKDKAWRDQIKFATLDLSSPYRAVFNSALPNAVQVADPFHVVKLANTKLDECRRRVQNELLGHRGRKSDPLYRCRRLLTKARERLDVGGKKKLLGLLKAGDPKDEVTTAWHAKEAVRELYSHANADVASEWLEELARDMKFEDNPPEVRSLGRTLLNWKEQIIAWHQAQVSNGPTEAVNNLIKRVKRAAFGFTSFRNYRIRSLLYAGKPNWGLLATIKPH